MDIQSIGVSSFAVYLSAGELGAMEVSPEQIPDGAAEELLGIALRAIGKKPCRQIETEFFPGKGDLLFFIRIASGHAFFFAFDSLENAIEAAAGCPRIPSALTVLDGRYILSVRPWDGDDPPARLAEFGEPLRFPPEYELFLSEHGEVLIPGDAIGALRRVGAGF